jgi:hypothetical protein
MDEAAGALFALSHVECWRGEHCVNVLDAADCEAGMLADEAGRSQHSELLRCQLPRIPICLDCWTASSSQSWMPRQIL